MKWLLLVLFLTIGIFKVFVMYGVSHWLFDSTCKILNKQFIIQDNSMYNLQG